MAEEGVALKDKVQELLDTAINPAVAGHGGLHRADRRQGLDGLHPDVGRLPGLRRGGRDAEGRHRADDLRGDPRGHRGPGHDGPRLGLEPLLRPLEGLTATPAASVLARAADGRARADPVLPESRMLRVLLLIPTTTYRTEDFVAAAAKLDVEMVVASERPNVLEAALPDNLLTLDFADPVKAARTVAEFARRHRVDAVVPVDDRTTVVGAAIAERLGLRSSSVEAVSTDAEQAPDARGVRAGRRAIAAVHAPRRRRRSRGRRPGASTYPCVLKPTILAGSRGVIRADDPAAFVAAFRRIAAILARARTRRGSARARRRCWSRTSSPGREVALEGLLVGGELHVLALFDKPDPLDGPYFEETIYVTPSRLPGRRPGGDRRRGALGGSGARAHRGADPRRAARERARGRGWSRWPRARSAASARARSASAPASRWRSWSFATRSASSSTRSSASAGRPAS